MVRTEDTSKKKKPTSSDGSKPKKEAEKVGKGGAADKKKVEASSSKASSQKTKDSIKDMALKVSETKSKPVKQPASLGVQKPRKADDYLGDFDLPSSSDEEELESNGHQPLYTGEQEEQELKPKVQSQP